MPKIKQAKYKKAPQAPRRFKSSYMFFSTFKHKQIRQELAEKQSEGDEGKISTTEVAKMVSQAWKSLSEDEREEWEEMARRDKARYEMEKSMYSGPWKVPATKRLHKDPSAPKRPMSAFLSFSNSKRAQVKLQNPNIGNAEISRLLAQMWKDASEEDRKDHIEKEFELRQKYKIDIAEWRKNSELEIESARKAREDEAMKAVLAGKSIAPPQPEYSYPNRETQTKDANPQSYEPPHQMDPGPSTYAHHPNMAPAGNGHAEMQQSYHPYQHHYGYAHGAGGPQYRDAPTYPHGGYYDRSYSWYDGGYGQQPYNHSYGQMHHYSQQSHSATEYPQYPQDPYM